MTDRESSPWISAWRCATLSNILKRSAVNYIDSFPMESPTVPKQLSETPTIHPSCRIVDSHLGRWTELMEGTTLRESRFGDYSYTAGWASIIYSDIGKFVNIAAMVRINPGNHPMDWVSMHHMQYRRRQYLLGDTDDASFFDGRRAKRCVLGHDVWIGHAAIVLPGVRIGNGAVVGAGSVVTKDVAPYTIVAGNPARLIRRRFSEERAAALGAIAWWDWDHETLRQRLRALRDPESFIQRYGASPNNEGGL